MSEDQEFLIQLEEYGLQYTLPVGDYNQRKKYGGEHQVWVHAHTEINTEAWLEIKLQLVEPCDTEFVSLSSASEIDKPFPLREPYEDADLSVDLTEYLESSRAGKGCDPFLLTLVTPSEEPLSLMESDVFKLTGYDFTYVVPTTKEYAGDYEIWLKATTTLWKEKETCAGTNCDAYRGMQAQTTGGNTCQAWSS